jgi:hypothetical protein
LSFKDTERLAESGIDHLAATLVGADDNILVEYVIGLFKAKVIN